MGEKMKQTSVKRKTGEPEYILSRELAGSSRYDFEKYGKIKLELTTSFEYFCNLGICLGIAGIIKVLRGIYKNPFAATSLLFPSVIIFVIFGLIRLGTDNYYIIDMKARAVLLHVRFFFFEQEFVYFPFNQIIAVSTEGRASSNQNLKPVCDSETSLLNWEYCVVLCTRNGKIKRITDYSSDLDERNIQARQLSIIANTKFVRGMPESKAEITVEKGSLDRYSVIQVKNEETFARFLKIIGLLIEVILFLGLLRML